MKSKKISLKKITVSNLSEDFAKRVYGGEAPTYGGFCTYTFPEQDCDTAYTIVCETDANCASGPLEPTCTRNDDATCNGCNTRDNQECPSHQQQCFTDQDCSFGQCTDIENTCPPTYTDFTCPEKNTCASCNNCG